MSGESNKVQPAELRRIKVALASTLSALNEAMRLIDPPAGILPDRVDASDMLGAADDSLQIARRALSHWIASDPGYVARMKGHS